MSKEIEKVYLRGIDPTKTFFMAISVGNLDGSLDDIGGEGVEGLFANEAEAVEALRELNDSYPTLEGYVFKCIPIRRVWRGRARVDSVPNELTPQRGSRRSKP